MNDYPDWQRAFRLVGSEIIVDINIAGVDVTMPISIDAATVTLDVNLAAQDADISINFNDQSVAVFDASEWYALQAQQVAAVGTATANDDTLTTVVSRTVPAGKVFFITGMGYSQYAAGTPDHLMGYMKIGSTILVGRGSHRGGDISVRTPMRATAGQVVAVDLLHNGSGGSILCFAAIWGYDRDV